RHYRRRAEVSRFVSWPLVFGLWLNSGPTLTNSLTQRPKTKDQRPKAKDQRQMPKEKKYKWRREDYQEQTRGLLIVHTGNGKGKTTCALGLMMRAAGQGLRCCMIQFMKSRNDRYGEHVSAVK